MPEVRVQGVKFEVLDRKWLAIFQLLLALCCGLFLVGAVGLYVLIDVEQQTWLSSTKFAYYYWKLAHAFPYGTAALVNGGLLGAILCTMKLYGHKKSLDESKKPKSRAGRESRKTR